jgi:hypothetical protein
MNLALLLQQPWPELLAQLLLEEHELDVLVGMALLSLLWVDLFSYSVNLFFLLQTWLYHIPLHINLA